jgi:hypothetical protein
MVREEHDLFDSVWDGFARADLLEKEWAATLDCARVGKNLGTAACGLQTHDD